MKTKNQKPLYATALVIVCIFVTFNTAHAAWTGPTGAPPLNNTASPLNVSTTSQTKAGGILSVYDLWANDSIAATVAITAPQFCIGASCITSWTGASQWTTSGSTIYNNNAGNVGIGTSTPGQKLDVNGVIQGNNELISSSITGFSNIRMIGGLYGAMWRNDGTDTYFLLTPSGAQTGAWNTLRPFSINDVTGNVSMAQAQVTIAHGTGSVTANSFLYNSDERLKKNIAPLLGNLQKVLQLEPVSYLWKDPKKSPDNQIGFIAQQVEKIVPELVYTNASTSMKSVDYIRTTPLLVGAVQELNQKITTQQKEINELKTVIIQLQAKAK